MVVVRAYQHDADHHTRDKGQQDEDKDGLKVNWHMIAPVLPSVQWGWTKALRNLCIGRIYA